MKAWASISVANVRHAWKRVAPFFTGEVEGERVSLTGRAEEVVQAAQRIPGIEITAEEAMDLVREDVPEGEMGAPRDDDIQDLLEERDQQDREAAAAQARAEAEGIERPPPDHISLHTLARILGLTEVYRSQVAELDTYQPRIEAFLRAADDTIATYRRLHQEHIHHQRQTTITRYLQRRPGAGNQAVPEVIDVESDQEVDRDVQEVLDAHDFEGFTASDQ